jgi:hypothetical protein
MFSFLPLFVPLSLPSFLPFFSHFFLSSCLQLIFLSCRIPKYILIIITHRYMCIFDANIWKIQSENSPLNPLPSVSYSHPRCSLCCQFHVHLSSYCLCIKYLYSYRYSCSYGIVIAIPTSVSTSSSMSVYPYSENLCMP